jgi:hypothetical protein
MVSFLGGMLGYQPLLASLCFLAAIGEQTSSAVFYHPLDEQKSNVAIVGTLPSLTHHVPVASWNTSYNQDIEK